MMTEPSAAAREAARQIVNGFGIPSLAIGSAGVLAERIAAALDAFVAARVAEERERCARIAESMDKYGGAGAPYHTAKEIAAAIRLPGTA